MVDAAGVLDRAVRKPLAQVAGSIHSPARIVGVRIRHELCGRQFRLVEIAAGQARAAHANLAQHAGRGRHERPLQQIDPGIGQRTSERDGVTAQVAAVRRDVEGRNVDAAFRRTVDVRDPR